MTPPAPRRRPIGTHPAVPPTARPGALSHADADAHPHARAAVPWLAPTPTPTATLALTRPSHPSSCRRRRPLPLARGGLTRAHADVRATPTLKVPSPGSRLRPAPKLCALRVPPASIQPALHHCVLFVAHHNV